MISGEITVSLDVNRCIIDMDFPNRRLQIERSASEGSKY